MQGAVLSYSGTSTAKVGTSGGNKCYITPAWYAAYSPGNTSNIGYPGRLIMGFSQYMVTIDLIRLFLIKLVLN